MSVEDRIKIMLVGESRVGKTNLIKILMGYEFNETEKVTSSATFFLKKLSINGKIYFIYLWDTICQEKLRLIDPRKFFYKDSKIVIFVYDITRKNTFEEIKNYLVNDAEEILGNDIIKGIIANKMDLLMNEEVTQEEGEEYAKSIGAKFLAISAKTDSQKKIEDFFIKLYEEYLIKNEASLVESNVQKKDEGIDLNKKKNAGGMKGKKCFLI